MALKLVLVALGSAALVIGAPSAAANEPQVGADSASATIADLEAQGYDVAINWVGGMSSVPLSECRVNAIHNPDRSSGSEHTWTVVYVDVSCPDDDSDDFGIWFGFG